jgi:hypothetical protein
MHIDNGVNVNAGWTKHIAVSVDGQRWEPIAKAGLDVRPVYKNANSSSPVANKSIQCIIKLVRGEMDNVILQFDVEKVENQAGWTGGATVVDDCKQAVIDITTWLGL